MAEAAERLQKGGIVAIPTETVYGLAANALDPDAVAQIYRIKGRPATNPLIVHVADEAAARKLASEWPGSAAQLAARFWPGPLTLVVSKAVNIPDIVTAGGRTVGLRVPNHPVALELLRLSRVPLAAPSANRSEEVSPTTAQHVADSLGPYGDDLLILDGNSCEVGIESTVVDVTGDKPRILRPGMVTAEMIGANGAAKQGLHEQRTAENEEISRSPGQMTRHYAPKIPLYLRSGDSIGDIQSHDGQLLWMPPPQMFKLERLERSFLRLMDARGAFVYLYFLPAIAEGYARGFYSALRILEEAGARRILVQMPPETPEWAAIHDRLRRAAAKKADNNT